MSKLLIKLLDIIWPLYNNEKINKKIEQRLDSTSQSYSLKGLLPHIENSEKITTETLKEHYDQTFEVKNTLEDKAKTNVIGITIAITLTTAATGLLSDISMKYTNVAMQWVCFIIMLMAIIYLIAAGLLAIRVLNSDNTTSVVPISKFAASDKDLRTEYDLSTESNKMRNTIRNNTIFTSYECIRNALICIFVILITLIFPYNTVADNSQSIYTNDGYTFSYAANSIQFLNDENVLVIIEDAILGYVNNNTVEAGVYINIIESNHYLFIQFNVQDDNIIINNVEHVDYIKP